MSCTPAARHGLRHLKRVTGKPKPRCRCVKTMKILKLLFKIYDQTEIDEMFILAGCLLVLFFSEVIAKGAF